MEYSRIEFDLVRNKEYIFYKLVINGKCQFDEFLCEVERNVRNAKSFRAMLALMDNFSARLMLPRTKFNYIQMKGRTDVYEFKKDDLRVYVIKAEDEITIAMGGYKKEQEKDIDKLKRDLKDYAKNE